MARRYVEETSEDHSKSLQLLFEAGANIDKIIDMHSWNKFNHSDDFQRGLEYIKIIKDYLTDTESVPSPLAFPQNHLSPFECALLSHIFSKKITEHYKIEFPKVIANLAGQILGGKYFLTILPKIIKYQKPLERFELTSE